MTRTVMFSAADRVDAFVRDANKKFGVNCKKIGTAVICEDLPNKDVCDTFTATALDYVSEENRSVRMYPTLFGRRAYSSHTRTDLVAAAPTK